MKRLLALPIEVNAFFVKESLRVACPRLDMRRSTALDKTFSLKKEAVPNVSAAFLTSTLLVDSDSEKRTDNDRDHLATLAPGMYLHWSVPDALAVARQHPGDSRARFPSLPNRWLIVCKSKAKPAQYYLVKSDQTYTKGSEVYETQKEYFEKYDIDLEDLPLCQIPNKRDHLPKELEEFDSEFQGLYSYSYIGMQSKCSYADDSEAIADLLKNEEKTQGGDFDLTVVGYGEPTFASIMTNSFNVFSLFQPLEDIEPEKDEESETDYTNSEFTYTVIGLYGDPTKDCLTHFKADKDRDKRYAALENEYEWKVEDRSQPFPERSVYYKRITVVPNQHAESEPRDIKERDCRLAVGVNGVDALASLLVNDLTKGKTNLTTFEKRAFAEKAEDQFEAFTLDMHLHHKKQDIVPCFEMMRHRKGFKPLSGGTRYQIKIREKARQSGQQDAPILRHNNLIPLEAAQLLNQLNRLQDMHDHIKHRLEGLRLNLFHAYVFYQNISNTEGALDETLPDPDDVWRELLRQKAVIEKSDRIVTHGAGQANENIVRRYLTIADDPVLKDSILIFLDRLAEEVEKENQRFRDRKAFPTLNAAVSFQREKLVSKLRDISNDKHEYYLIPQPAPRYYKPLDPTILIEGDNIPGLTTLYGKSAALSTAEPGDRTSLQIVKYSEKDPNAFLKLIEESVLLKSSESGHYQSEIVALEWEVSVHPVGRKKEDYAESYIHDNFVLQENFADLSIRPKSEMIATVDRTYRGHTVLVPHTAEQLKTYLDQFEERHGQHGDESSKGDARLVLSELQDILREKQVMTQSLGGLHDALLMRENNLQLPLFDLADFAFSLSSIATGDEEYYDKIQDYRDLDEAIDRNRNSNPIFDSYFQPIRSGLLNLVRLRLIDSFGRIYNLNFKSDEISKSSAYYYSNHIADEDASFIPELDHHVYLPPRINQFTQIDLQWLAAESAKMASSDQQLNHGPICGWLLPNNLEQSLMVYDSDGDLLGYINSLAQWVPAPGIYPPIGAGNIRNPHLRRLVGFLVADDIPATPENQHRREVQKIFINHFFDVVEGSLESIDPENFKQHQALSLLVGRPIALVRASIELRSRHTAAENKSIAAFIEQVEKGYSPKTFTHKFEDVKFPIRIGDHLQLHDGLVGYWIEDESNSFYKEGAFYAPNLSTYMRLRHPEEIEPDPTYPSIRTRPGQQQPAHTLSLSLSDKPITLAMLVDPRGVVHVTSGILPKTSFDIASHLYTDTLKKLAVTFLTTPLLTDTDHIRVPMPTEPGFHWSWVQKDTPSQWATYTDTSEEKGSALSQQLLNVNFATQQIVEGWLRLTPDDKIEPVSQPTRERNGTSS